MPRRVVFIWLGIICLGIVSVLAESATAQSDLPEPATFERQPPPPMPVEDDERIESRSNDNQVEPLLHGPVHEAFAAPIQRETTRSIEVSELPPEMVEEVPPNVAPENSKFPARWIPGYWGWDAREQSYVWVSGTWRCVPPEMDWIPGYWDTTEHVSRWVPGFWVNHDETELSYLPPPPSPREEHPPPAPDDEHFWVPGNWEFVEEEYRWRSGFWAQSRDDWVWAPDCYTWTPRGHVFVRGYWDLPLESRGMLFAPLAIRSNVGQKISPSLAINVRESLVHWFVAPNYGHYLFGDYYDLPQREMGLVSWYDYRDSRLEYDPLVEYYSARDVEFFDSLSAKHKSFKVKSKSRPALRWRDLSNESSSIGFLIQENLPRGYVRSDYSAEEFAGVSGYYRDVVRRRAEFEYGKDGRYDSQPYYVSVDSFLPPGHGGLPPGLAKKGLVPPGFGGAPPGQIRKGFESLGSGNGKPGKSKGKGKGKGKGR